MGAASDILLAIPRFILRQTAKKAESGRVEENIMNTLTPFEPDAEDYAAADRVIDDMKSGRVRFLSRQQMKRRFPKAHAREYGSDE